MTSTQDTNTLWYCEYCGRDFETTTAAFEHRIRNKTAVISIARDD